MDSINKQNPTAQTVSVSSAASAFDVLKAASQVQNCYKFRYKNYSGLGAYITSICGVQQNHEERMYWMFYVNGKKASVGVSSFFPKAGDVITMKYEKVNW